MEDCVFCKIASGEIPSHKLYENDNFFSVLDKNQDIKGHFLVISNKHFNNLLDLPSSLGVELVDCIKNTALKLFEEYDAEGFNVIQNNFESAGQVVNHIHFHIIPRRKSDGVSIY
jgi:histidine triad (HIT) family protein